MKVSEPILFILFGLVMAFIITMLLRDWLRKKRVVTSLANRPQHNDEQFARAYSRDPKRADIAVRARRVLSKNLEMDLSGLTPSDRLNDDLNAELSMNPDLFWELEAEFRIKIGVDDFETFEQTMERLVTFQDLVEFLQRKISEPQPETPAPDEDEKPSRSYELSIRSIPVLCIGGFLIAIVGIVVQKRAVMNLGGLIFISGVAIWGFANGGEFLRHIIKAVRGTSLKEIAARPVPFILFTCLALFFLWMGCTLSWGILKNLLSFK